jgi:cytochrome oxidase Cu insertion factor (SCO1/SenC/PrrC family)
MLEVSSRTRHTQDSRAAAPKRAWLAAAAWALLLCALSSSPALAQHQHAHEHRAAAPRPAAGPPAPKAGKPGVIQVGHEKVSIPDVEVLDQDGRKVRFYSDLFKGRVVVLSFFFTSCTYICPMQGQTLAKLRASLADRLGKEVFFVSVSKDPLTDTPERLKLWGEHFGVGHGWTLVTGAEGTMKQLLWDLIGEHPGRQLHDAVVLIGNDRTGVWEDAAGLSSTERLVEIINRVAQAPVTSDR